LPMNDSLLEMELNRLPLLFGAGLIFCLSCSSELYATKELSFPPGKANWKYKGTVTVSSKGAPEEWNLKTIRIVVKDRQDKVVLDDTTQYKAVRTDVRVVWKKETHIKLIVREKGTKGAADEQNLERLKKGPRTLSRTNYWFDSAKGRFR
jgi:hypothetical protein